MPTTSTNMVVPLVFVGLIAWRFYRRVRRNIGKQLVRRERMITGIVIYSVITVVLAVVAITNLKVLGGLGCGLVVGIPLGLVGLRLTQFEASPAGRFYTPNPYIGLSITAVLAVRIFYRLLGVVDNPSAAQKPPQLVPSALTYFLFGLLAGYYIAYYTGILMRSREA